MDTEHATIALADPSYYQNIVEHRRRFIFKTGVDYDTHHPDTINFIPPEGIIAAFESDYASMREQMIYDEHSKDFAAIIERLRTLLQTFRKLGKNIREERFKSSRSKWFYNKMFIKVFGFC